MKPLTIGKVARLAEVGVETIRFYEREGLIAEPPRREAGYRQSGYRQYPEETIARLRFIRRAKELGFTLREIKDLLSLRIDAGTKCDAVRGQAETKIAEIRDKVRTLQRMEQALTRLVADCRKRSPTKGCPILEAMEQEGES